MRREESNGIGPKIRVSGMVDGSMEKRLRSDGYHFDQCEERNIVG
jgi:hypothetical protein